MMLQTFGQCLAGPQVKLFRNNAGHQRNAARRASVVTRATATNEDIKEIASHRSKSSSNLICHILYHRWRRRRNASCYHA